MINFSINRKQSVIEKKSENIQENSKSFKSEFKNQSGDMMNTLGLMGKINMANITFGSKKQKTYAGLELAFSEKELDKMLSNDYLRKIKLISANSPAYKNLAEGDKKALIHLVKAAYILNDVHLEIDHEKNIEFRNALNAAAKKGDTRAKKTLMLFNGMNGIVGINLNSKMISLAKNVTTENNFYSSDITKEELKSFVLKKLAEGKKDDLQVLLSQRSIVRRTPDGELKGIDYIDAFPKHFNAMADELEKAAKVSTNQQFNEYLIAQAHALKKADPELDCEADKLWAKMQDTPLEFTITRENYDDSLTKTLIDDSDLKEKLENNGINIVPKDSLGVRVGIVNKKGTQELYEYKKYLPLLAERMPFKDKYKQTIDSSKDSKLAMVDVDLICLKGDIGAYRGGIATADNLPNNDKLSVKRGNGKRTAYHRQIRKKGTSKEAIEKAKAYREATLAPELHKYIESSKISDFAHHHVTIGHENAHSLGPSDGEEKLGSWHSIIEESKADMGGIKDIEFLEKQGLYTAKQKKAMLVDFAHGLLRKAKPKLSQPHSVRAIMQANYLTEKGAIKIDENGILHANLDEMIPAAEKMHTEIIEIQMSKKPKEARKFVKKYFKWTPELKKASENIRKVSKTLYGVVESPLAKSLLKMAK